MKEPNNSTIIVKWKLISDFSLDFDESLRSKAQLDPNLKEDPRLVLLTRKSSRFRYLLERMDRDQLAQLYIISNKELRTRIIYHLTDLEGERLFWIIKRKDIRTLRLSRKARQRFLSLLDFEMMVL